MSGDLNGCCSERSMWRLLYLWKCGLAALLELQLLTLSAAVAQCGHTVGPTCFQLQSEQH